MLAELNRSREFREGCGRGIPAVLGAPLKAAKVWTSANKRRRGGFPQSCPDDHSAMDAATVSPALVIRATDNSQCGSIWYLAGIFLNTSFAFETHSS